MTTSLTRTTIAASLAVALSVAPAARAKSETSILLDFGLEMLKKAYGDPDTPCEAPPLPAGAPSAATARAVMGGVMGAAFGLAVGGDVKSGTAGALGGKEVLDRLAAASRSWQTAAEQRDARVCKLLRGGRALLLPAVEDLYDRHGPRCGLSITTVDIDDVHALDAMQSCLLRGDAAMQSDLAGFRRTVVAQNATTCRAIERYVSGWNSAHVREVLAGPTPTAIPAVPFCPVNPR